MLRIGEAAKLFQLSNRTLRYWEEEGILASSRAENGYRYYDDYNTKRIKQIVFLRKLNMPIAQIEGIFKSDDFNVAMEALNTHLVGLKEQSVTINATVILINSLINHLQEEPNLPSVFDFFESQYNTLFSEHEKALQILLSGRKDIMSNYHNTKVRFVRLPNMTVVSYHTVSETPEDDVAAVMNPFIIDNQLSSLSGFRHFGFNNPEPSEGNPIYGYETWVTVPEGFEATEPFVEKEFKGGLYASIPTHLGEIGERWSELCQWLSTNDMYEMDGKRQCLEECLDYQIFMDTEDLTLKQLDLLIPIKLK